MTDVVRIGHDGASPEGENSTYVLREQGLLIDPGPPGDEAWETLRVGLKTAEISLTTIDRIVVTHWHADHAGLAPRLAEAADATVHMHETDAPLVGDYASERATRVERDAARLAEWGAPDEVVSHVRSADTPSPLPEAYPVRSHEDGDRIGPGRLIHTPGHTAGHLALAVDEALFVGDAILPTYTPNVGGSDTRMKRALATYLDTLDRLEERELTTDSGREMAVYPGHGSDLNARERIETIRRHHEQRIENVLGVVDEHNPITPWTVARELFGEMRRIHAKMGAGEAAAHLAYMAEAEMVTQVGEDPVQYVRDPAGPDGVSLTS